MHSIFESDGVPSDPYEIFCQVGTLIIEGRTTHQQVSKVSGDILKTSESTSRTVKPFNEGPHCPNFIKRKNVHKCVENSMLCIRHNKLKQYLQLINDEHTPIYIDVSLGPDCLCGELRSQSTLVSSLKNKLDVQLEEWTLLLIPKKPREPSPMTITSLFQAIRSHLHFSQLAAWYMSHDGVKPAHVNYRIDVLRDEDVELKSYKEEQYTCHDFPIADIDKNTCIKVSVKMLPRMEKIPIVICPQHGESACQSSYKKPEETLPLKFQGVRKKTFEYRERRSKVKRKEGDEGNCVPSSSLTDVTQLFDTFHVDLETNLKTHNVYYQDREINNNPFKQYNILDKYKKSNDQEKQMKCNSVDCRKLTTTNESLVDDRMQITCPISGKHHCYSECEDEFDLKNNNLEKPKRRRSLSKIRASDNDPSDHLLAGCLDGDKVLHGKFKGTDQCSHSQEICTASAAICDITQTSIQLDAKRGHISSKEKHIEEWPKKEPEKHIASSLKLEAESSNPFLDAILRAALLNQNQAEPSKFNDINVCDNSQPNRICSDIKSSYKKNSSKDLFLKPINDYIPKKLSDLKIEVEGIHSDIKETEKLKRKKSRAVKNLRNIGSENVTKFQTDASHSLSRNMDGFQSLFYKNEDSYTKSSPQYNDQNQEFEKIITENNSKSIPVPSAHEKMKFRRSLDTAAQLVFHRCSGLPLTSSPAPVRKHNSSFSFDSSLNSISAIKSALCDTSTSVSSEDETDGDSSLKSPASPGAWSVSLKQINYHTLSSRPLLGSFEESVLNGRLDPVSTVHGFTAELGASGSFCPPHIHLPVTAFFYTLGDRDKVSAPYLGHINLGKKGFCVPRSGTVQVTLFNPLHTVVKMFVVAYDLQDMPPNTHTFLRQRTLCVPSTTIVKSNFLHNREIYHKYLRYLVHLRFVSGKSGRIYLHTDIRMIIFRKTDVDTPAAVGTKCDEDSYELVSETDGPRNPKFSPRR